MGAGEVSGNQVLPIIGAGMGGLRGARRCAAPRHRVRIYEQAPQFARLGAGIQMSPNAMQVLRGSASSRASARPRSSRAPGPTATGTPATITNELPLGATAEAKYGAPYLLMHRGDLHEALAVARAAPSASRSARSWSSSTARTATASTLRFADGSDGARRRGDRRRRHAFARARACSAPEQPRFTGRVAYRTTFPAALLSGFTDRRMLPNGGARTATSSSITSPRDRDEIYFVTSVPEPEFTSKSWSATGDLDELRAAFAGFHDAGARVLRRLPARAQMGDRRARSAAALDATARWCCSATPAIR